MFTGMIEATARVMESRDGVLTIERPKAFSDVKTGSSISVSGVCLSVVQLNKKCIQFNVVPATLQCTTLGFLEKGDTVNVERAMKADARFEGHIVQGHIESTAIVTRYSLLVAPPSLQNEKRKTKNESTLIVRMPRTLLPFVVEKGSIAIDGVSLTIAKVVRDAVTVALIPHTLCSTTLGGLRAGDRVNIETDMIVRSLMSALGTSKILRRF